MIRPGEIILDCFAGGGGASTGIERAIGRPVDYAVNHNAKALAVHAANHPRTVHLQENIRNLDPRSVAPGRQIGLGWFSPDCTYYSKARGGKPFRDPRKAMRIRGLATSVIWWMQQRRPRVVMLENVEEFSQWGPLLDDGTPCPIRRGQSFRRWHRRIENLGYQIDMRQLVARVRFLSCEPLLSAIDLTRLEIGNGYWLNGLTGKTHIDHDGGMLQPGRIPHVDWVIAGGESGGKARPSHPDWFRSLRDDCSAAGVVYHHKQHGEWIEAHERTGEVCSDEAEYDQLAAECDGFISLDGHFVRSLDDAREDTKYRGMKRAGKKSAGRTLDGVVHDAFPEVRS